MKTKICKKCNIEKSTIEFYKKSKTNDKLRSICKACSNSRQTEYERKIQNKHKQSIININNTIKNKICTKCSNSKDIIEFSRDNSSLSGIRSVCKSCNKKYSATYLQNKEYARRVNLRKKNKYHSNIGFRLKENVVSRINLALKNKTKSARTEKLLGCTIEELKIYLESKFKEGMSWDNRSAWHIDHIIPCVSFDLSKEEEQKKCFHYTNLQPLWARENILKGSKIL